MILWATSTSVYTPGSRICNYDDGPNPKMAQRSLIQRHALLRSSREYRVSNLSDSSHWPASHKQIYKKDIGSMVDITKETKPFSRYRVCDDVRFNMCTVHFIGQIGYVIHATAFAQVSIIVIYVYQDKVRPFRHGGALDNREINHSFQ